MNSIINWIAAHWLSIAIPFVVFLAGLIVIFWLRSISYGALNRWAGKTNWQGYDMFFQAMRGPSTLWCLIISAYMALAISAIPIAWKVPVGRGLWSLFLLSLTLTALNLTGKFIPFYGKKLNTPQNIIFLSRNIARIVFFVVAMLILLDLWGVPTTPIILLILMIALAAVLAFRNIIPSLYAGFQLSTTGQIKAGDYIKLETGEEGHVLEINWRNTLIKALDESTIIIPNSKIVQSTLINYGRPLKKAEVPFRFHSRAHLKELTGLKARNLRELVDILKVAPDTVLYYHTHHFLEEHHYLTPEPSNDFAVWVSDALGDEVVGERLAAVNTFEFPALGALKERLVDIIEEHLARQPNLREALSGREFYFMKSLSVIVPTPYVTYDLRQFVEALRKISLGSIYFHIFESRLRLGRGMNDFSIWLEDSLDEKELADRIGRLDPYTYTLEGLRSTLIQLIEKRIK